MTTRPDHHEPLDAEERDLAIRLGRLGPLDGPSPALDAKILAAAHAAATTRTPSRRRHLAWLGIPPAVVTGMGVAAAAVLALGLVWQLRPQYSGVAARSEADSGEEIILIAEPSATASAPAINAPPPMPEQPASAAPAAPTRSATRMADHTASQAASKATVAAPAPAPAIAADESGALAAEAAPAETKREADAAAGMAASNDGFAADPSSAEIAARKSHATYTTAARATAERRARAAAAQAAAPPAAAAAEEEGTTLDRIEVTGSRIASNQDIDWSQVPVSNDTHLETVEWLERVRARRDDGDTDNARASLRLFQREHPRVRLPDDLRALLSDAKR